MGLRQVCRVCKLESVDCLSVNVPGTIKEFMETKCTVWKCSNCESLNALEPVDYDKVYLQYPIQKQKYDFFAKTLFSNRLNILKKIGIEKHHLILDYGCGSGLFVKFMSQHGYNCFGYDPHSLKFNEPSVLTSKFDFIISQDVFEHVDNPYIFLQEIKSYLNEKGKLVIGTPFSDNVDLQNIVDQVGILHQPFHRFVSSRKAINKVLSESGLKIEKIIVKSYLDTWMPFVNSAFLFRLFVSAGGILDIGFEPISVWHWIKNPSLLFWGFFGRFFVRSQNLLVVASTDNANE